MTVPAEWTDELVSAHRVRHADTGIIWECGVIRRRWPGSGRHSHFVAYVWGPLGLPGGGWKRGERLMCDAGQPLRFASRAKAEAAAARWAWLHGGRRWARVVDQDERARATSGRLVEQFWMCACSDDLELPTGWRRLDPRAPPPWASPVLSELEDDADHELVAMH